MKKIIFKDAFDFGSETLKANWKFLLTVYFILICVSGFFGGITHYWESTWINTNDFGQKIISGQTHAEMVFYFMFQFVYWIISLTVSFNLLKINLNILRKRDIKVTDLFLMPDMRTAKFYLANLIYGFMVVIGLIFFIVPGIYFYFKYFYTALLVADKDYDISAAAEHSAHIMRGNWLNMLGYGITMAVVCIGMILIGLLCLIIGVIPAIFITVQISTFANLYVYKTLSAK